MRLSIRPASSLPPVVRFMAQGPLRQLRSWLNAFTQPRPAAVMRLGRSKDRNAAVAVGRFEPSTGRLPPQCGRYSAPEISERSAKRRGTVGRSSSRRAASGSGWVERPLCGCANWHYRPVAVGRNLELDAAKRSFSDNTSGRRAERTIVIMSLNANAHAVAHARFPSRRRPGSVQR